MSQPSRLLSLLQLLRIPNVFTAWSDIAMGFLFVNISFVPYGGFALLLIASSCLYLSGMVFNDVFDVEIDRAERPFRPIPSGAISLEGATFLGVGLMTGGVLFGTIAGFLSSDNDVSVIRSGLISTCLAGCILLYDRILKTTPLGSLAMGGCRTLNVLLGMSLFHPIGETTLGFGTAQWCVAGGIGTYIAGVTWFARTEAKTSSRALLGFGLGIMILGIVLLSRFPNYGVGTHFPNSMVWPMLLLLVMFSVLRRCVLAIANPAPDRVQAAIKLCIFSLIVLNAAICLAVRGPVYGMAVLALLIPTVLLGNIVYST